MQKTKNTLDLCFLILSSFQEFRYFPIGSQNGSRKTSSKLFVDKRGGRGCPTP